MAKKLAFAHASRRERQILDILYRTGSATAAEIQQAMADAPSYSAVRTQLRILEEKGHVRHEQDGARYVYLPTLARAAASRSALSHLVQTFFDGSATQAITALLDQDAKRLSDEDWDRIEAEIERARKEGR